MRNSALRRNLGGDDLTRNRRLRRQRARRATLGQIETDEHGDHWLHVVGKGSKAGKVAPLAWSALNRHNADCRRHLRRETIHVLVARLGEERRNLYPSGD
jgi:hypothetical protein